MKIFALNITVDASSKIYADGCGPPGGAEDNPGSGEGPGGDPYYTGDGSGGGGAGYGALGGQGGPPYPNLGGVGGMSYGSASECSIQVGSGGGGGTRKKDPGGAGRAGGAGVWLDAETITIEGTISANGIHGQNVSDAGGGGGGSGGGILIQGKNVTILGSLSARGGGGGDAGRCGGGGGAGGRIKVFYEVLNSNHNYLVSGGEGGVGGSGYSGLSGNAGTTAEIQSTYTSSGLGVTYSSSGHFVSTVHDTGNESVWYGELTWNTNLKGQELIMKVRSDWNESMAHATPWNDCPELSSDDGENQLELVGISSVSPVGHRYIQFRSELSTEDESTTPVLTRIKVNYSFPAQSPLLANASGRIKFNSNYLYYPNQEIVYEHGAVIKSQKEGGFMLQELPLTISNKSGIPALSISLVELTGGNYSYSGATATSVKSTFKDYDLLANCLRYPNLTINLTTEYPSVWGNWFTAKIEEAGLGDSFYELDVTAEKVVVTLYGYEQGVELYLEKTEVEVKL